MTDSAPAPAPAPLAATPASGPSEFYCPITIALMDDPVICADGITYERSAIETWLRNSPSHRRSPVTNTALPHGNLVPNIALRNLIRDHRDRDRTIHRGLPSPPQTATAVSSSSSSFSSLFSSPTCTTPPSAPPISYITTGTGTGGTPGPSVVSSQQQTVFRHIESRRDPLSHEQAREALVRHCVQSWTLHKEPALNAQMSTCRILDCVVVVYETFYEKRTVAKVTVPVTPFEYARQQPGLGQGRPPSLDEIARPENPVDFQPSTVKVEVPNTSTAPMPCSRCYGTGVLLPQQSQTLSSGPGGCARCQQQQQYPNHPFQPCESCRLNNYDAVNSPNIHHPRCTLCNGQKWLREYMEMTSQCYVESTHDVLEASGFLPNTDLNRKVLGVSQGFSLLRQVDHSGAFGFDAVAVAAEVGYELQAIVTQSNEQVRQQLATHQHQTTRSSIGSNNNNSWGGGVKPLKRRLTVSVVPVTHVEAHYGNEPFQWYVYGTDRAVTTVRYPGNCCSYYFQIVMAACSVQ